MLAYRNLYQDQLSEVPRTKEERETAGYDNHRGWVFMCKSFQEKPVAVRTYQTLFALNQQYIYFTPNTFYQRNKRHSGALRWLNAMVIDIDVKNGQNENLILPDVLDSITAAGLPAPSMVVQTPSKGFHVYFYFSVAKRAFPKVTAHYERLQSAIAKAIGGDGQAIGAERWFRLPSVHNIIYQTDQRVSFDDLCDWFDLNLETEREERQNVCVDASSLLNAPAIQKLLQGVSEGVRDNTCYTLALAFKAAGYAREEAENKLQEWNERNAPPLNQIEVKRKVKSAYKKGAPPAPSAYWIRLLSDMSFSYKLMEGAKPREERVYSHRDEWEKDVLRYLKEQGGQVSDAQRRIAEAIKASSDDNVSIPYSTFKKIIERLVEIGMIIKKVEGKGRGAVTTISFIDHNKVIPFPTKKVKKRNGLNSNTYIDWLVGGLSSFSPLISMYFSKFLSLFLSGFSIRGTPSLIRLPVDSLCYST